MIMDAFSELNWLAVLVATLAWFAWSAIWYSVPPISKPWQKAVGISDEQAQGAPLAPILAGTVVLYFVTAVVIALLVQTTGASTVGDGIQLGVALGVGFGLATALVAQMYERKGSVYWIINGVNAIVAWSIVSVILALWD
jgi:hypothetical protein